MESVKYILDTNVISAMTKGDTAMSARLQQHRSDEIYLCQPVYYEALRGLLWKGATGKIRTLEKLRGILLWLELDDNDWTQAARYWAAATSQGKQLADVDLLIAAMATRLDGIIVSADDDFDALGVRREDWRKSP
ncbi:MAG: PIN domain-containing protein [Anaerolineae bacterium]|nr:PIN domain-containing protein [Anaerolineae bacterium]